MDISRKRYGAEDNLRGLSVYEKANAMLGQKIHNATERAMSATIRASVTINNKGGGGTDDKPDVIASPPKDLNTLSSFLNLRVVDVKQCYELWRSRGARFITEPKVHKSEMRCYMRDPDGYLIEVGQSATTQRNWNRILA